MNAENQPLVTDELLQVQDFRKITDHFREIRENTPRTDKEKPEDVNM